MTDLVEIPAFPGPLRWLGQPEHWQRDGEAGLLVGAGAGTDWFIDPNGGQRTGNAPALIGPAGGDLMLSARVRADLATTYDAAALFVHIGPQTWAKLCMELSPQGEPTVVTVVTARGVSDDCNSYPVDAAPVGGDGGLWLRASRLGPAYAFHVRTAAEGPWRLVRYFALESPGGEPEYGFLAQSPLGGGCTVQFDHISFLPERLADLRGGG